MSARIYLFAIGLILTSSAHAGRSSDEKLRIWESRARLARLASEARVPKAPWRFFDLCRAPSEAQKCEKNGHLIQGHMKEELEKYQTKIEKYSELFSKGNDPSTKDIEKPLAAEIEEVLAKIETLRSRLYKLFPETTDPLSEDSHPLFQVRDFGGGGNCFFLSLAAILSELDGPRTQEWVRKEMGKYLNSLKGREKAMWQEKLDLLRDHDPDLGHLYKGIKNLHALALRIQNAPPYDKDVYEGDELSMALAEQVFDIQLITIAHIKLDIKGNDFKPAPASKDVKNRFAFLRHTGDDTDGHFQVHAYRPPAGKGTTRLGYSLRDAANIPQDVKLLFDRYAEQYQLNAHLKKACRPRPNVCSQYNTNQAKCDAVLIHETRACVWTNSTPARCEGNAGCEHAGQLNLCEATRDPDDNQVCFLMADHCVENRAGAVGCRSLINPTPEKCEAHPITYALNPAVTISGFCQFMPENPSSCALRANINPCSKVSKSQCQEDKDCEWR